MKHTPEPIRNHVALDCVRWVLSAYHHLCPFGKAITGHELAGEIRRTYDCGQSGAGPINESAARVADRMPGKILRTRPDSVTYSYL